MSRIRLSESDLRWQRFKAGAQGCPPRYSLSPEADLYMRSEENGSMHSNSSLSNGGNDLYPSSSSHLAERARERGGNVSTSYTRESYESVQGHTARPSFNTPEALTLEHIAVRRSDDHQRRKRALVRPESTTAGPRDVDDVALHFRPRAQTTTRRHHIQRTVSSSMEGLTSRVASGRREVDLDYRYRPSISSAHTRTANVTLTRSEARTSSSSSERHLQRAMGPMQQLHLARPSSSRAQASSFVPNIHNATPRGSSNFHPSRNKESEGSEEKPTRINGRSGYWKMTPHGYMTRKEHKEKKVEKKKKVVESALKGFVRGEGMEELQTSVDVEIAHEKFVRELYVKFDNLKNEMYHKKCVERSQVMKMHKQNLGERYRTFKEKDFDDGSANDPHQKMWIKPDVDTVKVLWRKSGGRMKNYLKMLRTKKDIEEMLQDKEYVDYEEDEIEHIKEENVKPPAEEARLKALSFAEEMVERHRQQSLMRQLPEGSAQSAVNTVTQKFLSGDAQLDRRVDVGSAVLNLSFCKLTEFHISCVSALLVHHRHLTTLQLSGNVMDDTAVKMLFETLGLVKTIRHLDLSENPITFMGIMVIAKYLKVHDAGPLLSLNLHSAIKGDARSPDKLRGVALLAECLEQNKSLTNLDISSCQLSDSCGEAVGRMLEWNNYLQVLNASWNQFALKSATAITAGLRFPRCVLEQLDLSNNAFGDKGGAWFGQAVEFNETLQTLDLSACGIAETACMVLAHGLRNSTTLTTLNLNSNPLGDRGGACLFAAMQSNACVSWCGMQRCGFGQMAAKTPFNRDNPEGTYSLNLATPEGRQVAIELLDVRNRVLEMDPLDARGGLEQLKAENPGLADRASKEVAASRPKSPPPGARGKGRTPHTPPKSSIPAKDAFGNIVLDGKVLKKEAINGWPAEMPEAGTLNVRVHWTPRPLRNYAPMPPNLAKHALSQMGASSATDKWRLQFLRVLVEVSPLSCQQAKQLLYTFNWGPEKVEAIHVIYGSIIDCEQLHLLMEQLLPRDLESVISSLGNLLLWNNKNISSAYILDLSRKMDYEIAQKLINSSRMEGLWRRDPFMVNLRNMKINNDLVPDEVLQKLDLYELPKGGMLTVDYVAFKQLPPEAKLQRCTRSHFDRFLGEVQKLIATEFGEMDAKGWPDVNSEPWNWFPDPECIPVLNAEDKTPSSRLSKLIPWSIMNRAKIDGRSRARRLPTSRPRRLSTFTERMSQDNTNRRRNSIKGRISITKLPSRRGDLKPDEGGPALSGTNSRTRRNSIAGLSPSRTPRISSMAAAAVMRKYQSFKGLDENTASLLSDHNKGMENESRNSAVAGAESASSSKDVSAVRGRRKSWSGERRNKRSLEGPVTEQQTAGLKGLDPETFTSPQNSPRHFSSTRSRRHSFKEDDDNSAPGLGVSVPSDCPPGFSAAEGFLLSRERVRRLSISEVGPVDIRTSLRSSKNGSEASGGKREDKAKAKSGRSRSTSKSPTKRRKSPTASGDSSPPRKGKEKAKGKKAEKGKADDGVLKDKHGRLMGNWNLITGIMTDKAFTDEEEIRREGCKALVEQKAMKLLHYMRMFSNKYSITADMLMSLMHVVAPAAHGGFRTDQGQLKARDTNVVNAILTFYEHLVDRGAMSHIVRALGKEEQVALQQRLGWNNLLDVKRPDGIHYYLHLINQTERSVANKLNKIAIKIHEPRTCWENLLCQIHEVWRPLYVKEDNNMWSTIIVSSHSLLGDKGLICFDFTGTKAPIDREKVVTIQKHWHRYVTRKWYVRTISIVRRFQIAWRLKKSVQRLQEEEERKLQIDSAEDFW